MRTTIGIAMIMAALAVLGVSIYKKTIFKQQVTGFLKNAADANTIDLAHEELTKAVNYLEANNITSGYTSVLWNTPDEDVGFWYRNLKASQQELESLENPTALEKTNVLMKLRETLLDTGEKTKVTVPDGIHLYPDNGMWLAMGWGAAIVFFVGLFVAIPKKAWEGQG